MADKDLKVNISEFVLINYSREYAIDIKRLCSQFNLYQDLFSSVMTFEWSPRTFPYDRGRNRWY